jgi:hypothetical protein
VEVMMRESGRRIVPIEVRPQILYNPTMRSPNFYVPGVIGVVLQIGTTFATAMAVVRERERGTLEGTGSRGGVVDLEVKHARCLS